MGNFCCNRLAMSHTLQTMPIHHIKFLTTLLPLLLLLSHPISGTPIPNWGLYTWISPSSPSPSPISPSSINLSHPSHPGLSIIVSLQQPVRQLFNAYNVSAYQVGDSGVLHVITQGEYLEIQVNGSGEFVRVGVECHGGCVDVGVEIGKQLQDFGSKNEHCNWKDGGLQCTSTDILHIPIYTPKTDTPGESLQKLLLYKQENIKRFHSSMSLPMQGAHLQITQYAISQCINSLCMYQWDTQYYLGFCDRDRTQKWKYDIKFAPFTIYLLADYDQQLAYTIYRDYFDIYESQLRYPINKDSQVLPMPEHVEIFSRFGSIYQLQDQTQLLNTMFVTPMLNQLGTLHEQVNYRQAKKLHPLLIKMLKQRYSAGSPSLSLKSLYEQSFTDDFKYHNYGEQLEQSIAKIAWIYKVVDTYTSILIKNRATYMPNEQIRESVQEQVTLINIMKVFVGEDAAGKGVNCRDIIQIEGALKVYGSYIGYDAILPYVYGLCKTYPQQAIKSLITPLGLKSSNQAQLQPFQKSYKFRGDIHSYFNIKLLTGLAYRVNEDKSIPEKRKKQLIEPLDKLGRELANKIIQDYKSKKEIYTRWNARGEPKEACPWKKIVSALFLRWL